MYAKFLGNWPPYRDGPRSHWQSLRGPVHGASCDGRRRARILKDESLKDIVRASTSPGMISSKGTASSSSSVLASRETRA
jgi:hypothetical protein